MMIRFVLAAACLAAAPAASADQWYEINPEPSGKLTNQCIALGADAVDPSAITMRLVKRYGMHNVYLQTHEPIEDGVFFAATVHVPDVGYRYHAYANTLRSCLAGVGPAAERRSMIDTPPVKPLSWWRRMLIALANL